MNEHVFTFTPGRETIFAEADGAVWLQRLGGLTCGHCRRNAGPQRARGLFTLRTSLGRAEGTSLTLVKAEFTDRTVQLAWQAADGALEVESRWAADPQTGVWSRRDALVNLGSADVRIFQARGRFVFTPGAYEAYSQESHWCSESQGSWQPLSHGELVLRCEGGRTTQGGTPYLCLRPVGERVAAAFHVLPRSNWQIRAACPTAGGDSLPFAVVELGLADRDLDLLLAPGERLELPEILVQPVPQGEPELAAPHLHEYLVREKFASARLDPPVVYNTWFDVFDLFTVDRLGRQLAAAREIGCEVFVIDAGWYGMGEGGWAAQTGDWREKTQGAFRGRMAEFADEVRSAGMDFGLWVEPERYCPNVPVRKEHPDWFRPAEGGGYRPDLSNPAVRDYMLAELSRLVKQYRLAWMKIDFNHDLGADGGGEEFSGYYRRWYAMLDELRRRCPQTFIEGCASGGMRLDIESLCHFDGHFLSDTVEPVDVLRITQGGLLRLPPGRLCKWAVLRSAGRGVPAYGRPPEEAPETVLTPGTAAWGMPTPVGVDFAARVALMGVFGISGDPAGLSAEARSRLAHHVALFKQWRKFIVGSVAELLTPPRPRHDRRGWIAIQLRHADDPRSLLFVYRLYDMSDRWLARLRGLEAGQDYRVIDDDLPDAEGNVLLRGEELMGRGLDVQVPGPFMAKVFAVSPA
ncbi:MAG TPA: alpha-galactosidase [Phycisphaerae bacterium]|nr:alpha-galactosidase [Phycisphaerae bacterium]